MTDPKTEHAKVQAERLSTARRVFLDASWARADEMSDQDDVLDESRPTLDAGLSAVLRMNRHDGDCQAFQHTYTANQGEPGVYPHGDRMVDAVGSNGRRLLVRDDPDGIYIGGVVLTPRDAAALAGAISSLAGRRMFRA